MNTICVYYEAESNNILDIVPHDTSDDIKANITKYWQQQVSQKIFKALSAQDQHTISGLANNPI